MAYFKRQIPSVQIKTGEKQMRLVIQRVNHAQVAVILDESIL